MLQRPGGYLQQPSRRDAAGAANVEQAQILRSAGELLDDGVRVASIDRHVLVEAAQAGVVVRNAQLLQLAERGVDPVRARKVDSGSTQNTQVGTTLLKLVDRDAGRLARAGDVRNVDDFQIGAGFLQMEC